MNATTIINDSMTLEEKLQAIDEAMKAQPIYINKNNEVVSWTPDPAELLMCESCQ